ncbi:ATP-binding protein [Robertkochia solimangrovi]|uniref:DNA polymerase III subunit n=1 Tax=Robertkochia solimangrovi TaxID=2213046 RepID=UPI00117EBFA6|nr:DNA polymerase III subunit delta' [Robertkochia solimangrovi]TRZ46046.1 DNA polymerase III subunit delta' [Robertkochia solimangrovi]
MLFSDIIGQEHIKKHLVHSADNGRIPHAQLFVGPEGCGLLSMAIAYAQYVLCKNTDGENNNGNSACNIKFNAYSHPDVHFSYPVSSTDKVKSHPVSKHFLGEWLEFLKTEPYGNLFDWYKRIGIEKKQGLISVDESTEIIKSLSLKAYEGGYKVAIIWMAEKMNDACANKLLKLIEEPPGDTLILLLAEDVEQIIGTIRSRCQILHFPALGEQAITDALITRGTNEAEALKIAHRSNGNFNKALDLVNQDSEDTVFEEWFVFWVRTAFRAKGNKTVVQDLTAWSDEISKTGRETQKKFLEYCINVFRQALMLNYNAGSLSYMEFESGFDLHKFAPFVHGNNIQAIFKELEDASYHIQRNANAKIVFTDLSIKLTRFLHMK